VQYCGTNSQCPAGTRCNSGICTCKHKYYMKLFSDHGVKGGYFDRNERFGYNACTDNVNISCLL
jgi:Cys-rich repeat protein